MNARDYFLHCVNAHVARLHRSIPDRVAMKIQEAAWRVPPLAVPEGEPAKAALDFFGWAYDAETWPRAAPGATLKPDWLEEYESIAAGAATR